MPSQALHPPTSMSTEKGEWPPDPALLPCFLSQNQLAHLLNMSVRTLERRRRDGSSLPYVTLGRRVLYPRDFVLEHLMRSVTSKR